MNIHINLIEANFLIERILKDIFPISNKEKETKKEKKIQQKKDSPQNKKLEKEKIKKNYKKNLYQRKK